MATEIQTIKASQLVELTEVTDSNYVVVTDGATSKKVKATKLKGNSLTSTQQQQLSAAYTHSQTTHVQSRDIPTKTSQLANDSGFVNGTYVTNAINNAQLGGGGNSGLTSEQEQQLNTAYTHSQSPHVNNEDLTNITSAVNLNSEKITELNSEVDKSVKFKVVGEGVSVPPISGGNSGLTSDQQQRLNTAYTHSQSPHVKTSDIPTKTSQLTNDSKFATETYVTNAINNAQLGGGNTDIDLSIYQLIQDNTLTTTAKTIPAAINELKSGLNGIKVPTKTSELTNNSGFITTIPEEYITETELNAKGYLTSHQDISNLQNKTDNSLVTTKKTVIGAINELKGIIDSLQNRITALENQQDTTVSVSST